MKTALRLIIASLVAVLILPVSVWAMAGMYTAKYIDGPNVILLTNNVHDTHADVPITYNLRVYDMEGKPTYFGNVQLALKQGAKVLEEHNVHRTEHNDASISLTFPKQGTFAIEARFLDNDKQIAWGEFPIIVSKSPNESWLAKMLSLQTAIGVVLGVGTATLFMHRNRFRHIAAVSKSKKIKS